jgi:hypothetical protein
MNPAASTLYNLANCQIELLATPAEFFGIGRAWIGDTLVRSGRLPIRPATQTFKDGWELSHLEPLKITHTPHELRISTRALFKTALTRIMRDHSFDPIHDTSDWDFPQELNGGTLDLVLRPASDSFHGLPCQGFSYHWEWRGERHLEIFFLLDRSSFELGGDIHNATVYNQSACSDPAVTFDTDNPWSTEGLIHWVDGLPNPVMTHNLPRWASHQAFDFQFKGSQTLLGVYERVDLIRSLLTREKGQAELKCFDKHIFDQTDHYATSPKKILLASNIHTVTDQQNLWTWVFDETHRRARAEFGLKPEPTLPRLSQNYWRNFTLDTYHQDLLPAAINLGFKQIFIDNINKSDLTDDPSHVTRGNMCCGHEYEPAPALGGTESLKKLIETASKHQIQVVSWTNNDQSCASPLNKSESDEKGWYVRMECTRLKYGGAYTNVFNILDFSNPAPCDYWTDSLLKTRQTGLNCYLFDSFYNLGFMPVTYRNANPKTMWRQLLQAFKKLQDNDVHFLIESFGPFGQPAHGHPASYSLANAFICYQVGPGNGYTTIGLPNTTLIPTPDSPQAVYYLLAHMAYLGEPLFKDAKRIDQLWTPAHKQALADYHTALPDLHTRILQPDGQSVVWLDESGHTVTLFNFAPRSLSLPGKVVSITQNAPLPNAGDYTVSAMETLQFTTPQKLTPAHLKNLTTQRNDALSPA